MHGSRAAVAFRWLGNRPARAMGTPSAAAQAGFVLWNMKDVRHHEKFSGENASFEGFAFRLEAEVEQMGWKQLYDSAKSSDTVIANAGLNEGARELSANLYYLLSQTMLGKAHVKVKNAGSGQGFEALRRLYKDYEPRGQLSQHGLMGAIINPEWWHNADHRDRSFYDVLTDWQQLIVKYETNSGEVISNTTKCSTVLAHGPKNIKRMLDSCAREIRERDFK